MIQEQLTRKVTSIGNGAHIFAPKEWVNEEVILIRIPKKDAKNEALKLLYPHLNKVIAAFVFGSYARGEQEKDSDVDLFVISDKSFKVHSKNIEVIVIPEKKLEEARKLNPILFNAMLQEALPIINGSYLEKLKQKKQSLEDFKTFIQDTKKLIKMNKEMIELERLDKYSSASTIYSLILRLRGVFLINLILNKQTYSKKLFSKWVIANCKLDYEKIYNIYKAIKYNKKPSEKASISEAESLLLLLEKEIEKYDK